MATLVEVVVQLPNKDIVTTSFPKYHPSCDNDDCVLVSVELGDAKSIAPIYQPIAPIEYRFGQ